MSVGGEGGEIGDVVLNILLSNACRHRCLVLVSASSVAVEDEDTHFHRCL